jgi:hypothetical protein
VRLERLGKGLQQLQQLQIGYSEMRCVSKSQHFDRTSTMFKDLDLATHERAIERLGQRKGVPQLQQLIVDQGKMRFQRMLPSRQDLRRDVELVSKQAAC